MGRLLVRRLLQVPLILAIVFLCTFTLAWIVPGNPLERTDGPRPPREVQQAMLRQYNLDSPARFLVSYAHGLVRGDLGPSLQYRHQRVNDIIATGLPVSAALGALAILIAMILGLLAGAVGALRPGSILDHLTLSSSLLGVSLPSFVIGAVLLALVAGKLALLPFGPWEWPGWHIGSAHWWSDAADALAHMLLPAITLAAAPAAYIARLTRLGLADVMASDYIRTAAAKGLAPGQILRRHAMKIAFLPVLSFLAPAAAAAMTGSFVVEQVFAIPGLGNDFVRAVQNKDQFLILGLVLVYSTILIVFNLVVDLAYVWIDPRIQIAEA
ncbi:MAG: ABC transporter permease [Phycisphaeraceae bacterium]|nr:ABC transporter permease [Phycisphaeraceae bacterium]